MIEQTNGQAVYDHYELRNRYVFKGLLVMQTAFHIGGGKVTLSPSNSPVVLTPEQIPFIPGSSFKGALRSTVEKLAPNLPGLRSCALIELSGEALAAEKKRNLPVCPTVRQREIVQERRDSKTQEEDAEIVRGIYQDLCDTCRLFGSPYAAARINVNDLYMPKGEWNGITQLRDGVAIDRDSEKARDRLKYDFEVVPSQTAFELEITLENATQQDLQLACVGLSEFVHGFGVIGGKRSRGLGACKLEELKVSALELAGEDIARESIKEGQRNQRLRDYLLRGQFSDEFTGEKFLDTYINRIFE